MDHQPAEAPGVQRAKRQVHLSDAASSHDEFSFTVSLYSSRAKCNPVGQPDFSPAGDIFYGGRLLPLVDCGSTTLSVKEWQQRSNAGRPSFNDDRNLGPHSTRRESFHGGGGGRPGKSKPFFRTRDEKGHEYDGTVDEKQHQLKKKKKSRFDVVKKYFKLIKLKPKFLSFRSRIKGNNPDRLREYSSAPVTMRTSPANSGAVTPAGAKSSDSTVEELQAAIQAAIAHCKNSIKDDTIIKYP
ncbi:BRI1 kinase inhibitor 1-like [Andrographis paniculata]|uniref:BRI1 kinase inhibitor 1-like n=1 Tax=Andrographis paniculata TaxID=175694 RepID=UPI0021E84A7B|nr:BRI1 kinase inhibitor 1-like [Andrographis paniculata]